MAILSGIYDSFPNFIWNQLLPQTELTLNLLRQSNLAPAMYAWEHFNCLFNCDATPLVPIGFSVIIHNKPNVQKTWDFRGRKAFNIGTALNHYRYFHVFNSVTKDLLFSDTVEVLHA